MKLDPNDWREKTMSKIRLLIKEVDPEVVEEKKYKTATNPEGVFVWYHDGMICTGETYKQHLRFGFTKGQELKGHDPKGLINTYRAIVLREEDKLDENAFKDLFHAAVLFNKQKALSKKSK